MNYTEIPFCSPVKFYINDQRGMHLDDNFACEQILDFMTKVCYKQKWQTGDETKFQIISTVIPSVNMQVYTGDAKSTPVSFPWTQVTTNPSGANVYECTINLDSNLLPKNRTYHLFFKCELMSYSAQFISEPIDLRDYHPNTLLFTYKNSVNAFGAYFITGLIYRFRCEAGIMDYQPESESFDFTDQIHDVKILSATPYDTFKLYVGTAPGVPNYIIKILNFVFACDYVGISKTTTDKTIQYVKPANEKWEATRLKGWPNFGWATTIQPAVNISSLQYNDLGNDLPPGFVVAYDIDTDFFSLGELNIVHIEEITQH